MTGDSRDPPAEAFRAWTDWDNDTRGLVHLTAGSKIASWNASAVRISGCATADAIGRPWTDFAPLPTAGTQRERHTLIRSDHVSVPVVLSASPLVRDGALLGFALVIRETPAYDTAFPYDLPDAYRTAIDQSADAVFIHHHGIMVDVNRAACDSLGYTRDELLGTTPDHFDPDVNPDQMEGILERLKAGEAVTFDSRHRRKDGSMFPVEVRIRTFMSGGTQFAFSAARDITERKRVEEEFRASEARYAATVAALRSSEERFEFALRGANDGIWDWNLVTNDVVFSSRWKSMLGYADHELPDTIATWRMLLHPEDAPKAEQRVGQFLSKAIPNYEIEFRMAHKDGGYRVILARGYLVWDDDGRPVRIVGTHVDITERKEAEIALQKSEEMLRRAQAIAHVANWSFDIATGKLTTSEDGRRILNWTSEPRAEDVARMVHPEDHDRFTAVWRAACKGAPYEIEHRVVIGDETRWVHVTATTDLDGDGRPRTIIGVTQDITARRKLEAQVQQVQKMEAIGQLAGGVAHDFNNLLTVINSSADLMLEELPPGTPNEDLTMIRAAGERAAELTHQLLAFSRQQILQARVVSMNEVVTRSEKMFRRLIGEDITIVTLLETSLSKIVADPGQLDQVVLNLVVNARDAMPTGGTLTIETRNTIVNAGDADAVPAGSYVALSVRDTGIGVPDALKVKIFEPFFTTKGVGKGTGLGLATVYGIVKQSDGHISVASPATGGTVMTLLFPAASPRPSATVAAGHAAPARAHETILLVEDEEPVRRIARRALEKHGYTVLEANGGAMALEISRTHVGAIHLLITDVVMPEMSGRQVADTLRSGTHGLPVLFMSGYTDDAIVRHGVLEARDHFLAKPFTPVSLIAKVREVLRGPSAT